MDNIRRFVECNMPSLLLDGDYGRDDILNAVWAIVRHDCFLKRNLVSRRYIVLNIVAIEPEAVSKKLNVPRICLIHEALARDSEDPVQDADLL